MIDLPQQFLDAGADLLPVCLQSLILGRQAGRLGACLGGFFDGGVLLLAEPCNQQDGALDAAWRVGRVVVENLVMHWDQYQSAMPR